MQRPQRECYRCGKLGDIARNCDGVPHCGICQEAGRAADHIGGGSACKAPPPKRNARRDGPRAPSPRVKPVGRAPEGNSGVAEMEVDVQATK